MMHRNSLLFLALIFLALSCDTGNNVDPVFQHYFVKYYGEDGNQESADMLVNTDGSMILLGNTLPLNNSGATPFLVKVDPSGNVLWSRTLGAANETAVDAEFDLEGNIMIVSNIGSEPVSRIRLFRISQQGKTLDSLKIEMGEKQVARSVIQASNRKFLIAGYADGGTEIDSELPPPADEADIIILEVDEAMTTPMTFLRQGGEHVGTADKIYEELVEGKSLYRVFCDSDRPNKAGFKRSLEVIQLDGNGIQKQRWVSGLSNELQIIADAIETKGSLQEGWLMIGTTFPANNSTRNIYITQYVGNSPTPRLDMVLKLDNTTSRFEGVSAAVGDADDFYVLANEITQNNKHNICLLKMAGDGEILGTRIFGTLEGDDKGSSVMVLPDRRVALFGTIELETQRKMALMVISPNGKFSN